MYEYFRASHKKHTVMKQTLIALMALFVLAGCEQKAEEATTENEATTTMNEEGGNNPMKFTEYLVPEADGNAMIQRYHAHLLQAEGMTRAQLREKHLSFLIDAEGLRTYLDTDPDFTDVVFYLAMDDQQKMTLVYVGAERDSMDVIVEKAYEDEGGNKFMMDNIWPCPDCDRDRIYINQ